MLFVIQFRSVDSTVVRSFSELLASGKLQGQELLVVIFAAINLLQFNAQIYEENIDTIVIAAFKKAHAGFSSDEVLLNDELNQKFINECKSRSKELSTFQCNWRLMNLRKAGKLSTIKTTVRNRVSTDEFQIIAEIAARSILDKAKISIDRVLAEPKWRIQLDDAIRELDGDADLYLVRKAIFKLRKSRRLRPELITRIADWDRKITTFSLAEFKKDFNCAPELPGIYIFHDEKGYLYIGHSSNVRKRLESHIDQSSNLELSRYLSSAPKNTFVEIHSFGKDTRMNEGMIRRAYESELIRNRKPRFNILP